MKRVMIILACLSLAFVMHHADAQEGHAAGLAAKLPLCPLMGEPIDLNLSVKTDNGPAFFCCGGCVKKYNKNPDKYAEKIASQQAELAKLPKVQVLCPVSGNATDPKVTAEHDGQTISFCCGGCAEKYKANPAEFKSGLANSYTWQVICPVMGEKITPTASVDLPTGEKIYLCCQRCDKGLLKNPEKYAPKLAAMGVFINLEKIKEMTKGG